MGGIYWLASYPKSGNTWFRAFLHNLQVDGDTPADINEFQTAAIASSRDWIDEVLTFDSTDLTSAEIERLRPTVYGWAANSEEIGYHKIHDAYTRLPDGEPLVSREGTLGAVYIVRNPLDLASSIANHMSCSVDDAISLMGDPERELGGLPCGLNRQVPQRLFTWSAHVESWIDACDLQCKVVRYEDMWAQPVETFTGACAFLGLPTNRSGVEKAIRFSAFSELSHQEEEHGFVGGSGRSSFFRRGQAGGWRAELTSDQVARIVADHGTVMRRLGYLDPVNDLEENTVCRPALTPDTSATQIWSGPTSTGRP